MEDTPLKRPRTVAFPSHGNHFHNPPILHVQIPTTTSQNQNHSRAHEHHHQHHVYRNQQQGQQQRHAQLHLQQQQQLEHRGSGAQHIRDNTHFLTSRQGFTTTNPSSTSTTAFPLQQLQLTHRQGRHHDQQQRRHQQHQTSVPTRDTAIDPFKTNISVILQKLQHNVPPVEVQTHNLPSLSHQRKYLQQFLVQIKYHPKTRTCHCQPSLMKWIIDEWKIVDLIGFQLKAILEQQENRHGHQNHQYDHQRQHGGHENQDRLSKRVAATIEETNDVLSLWVLVLDIFYRYCPELTSESDIEKNFPEILQLLHCTLEHHRHQRHDQKENHAHTLPMNQNCHRTAGDTEGTTTELDLLIVSIWHCSSSCSAGTLLLIQHPATLPTIVQTLSTNNRRGCYLIQQEVLGLLKNLTYFGEDHRRNIVEETNMIEALTAVADVAPNRKSLERLSAVVRNLALSIDVRLFLAQRADILTLLIRLATLSSSDINLSAREGDDSCRKHILRNVLSTFSSVAMDANSALPVIMHGDGIIIEMLSRFLSYQHDSVVRKRSARTLRLLARNSTISILLRDAQMIERMLHVALADKNSEVQTEATEALAGYCSLIKSPMIQQKAILDSLVRISKDRLSATPSKQMILTRALQEHTSLPENREAVIQREDLIELLIEILKSSQGAIMTKKQVCMTFIHLSENESTSQVLSQPYVLGALVDVLEISDSDHNEIHQTAMRAMVDRNLASLRDDSVRVMLNLAKFPTNWTSMAQQPNLLQSLVRFALSTSIDDGLKKKVKSTILVLAAEL